MTACRLLWDSSRDDLSTVIDYDIGQFDLTMFWKAEPLAESDVESFQSVILTVGEKERSPDLMGNPLSWMIVSRRLMDHIRLFAGNSGIEFYPLRLLKPDKTPTERYYVMHVTATVDALNLERSTVSRDAIGQLASVGAPVLRAEAIADRHLFRVSTFPMDVYFSDDVARSMHGLEFAGIALQRCKVD